MAKQFPNIGAVHRKFIEAQHMFFVATAGPEGRVNLSPKGMDSLRVIDENRIHWLNVTGSGNETAGHLLQNPRMTLMWCGFEEQPMIMRAYGTARAIHRNDPDWDRAVAPFPPAKENRQVFDLTVEVLQTSCGYAVPFMEFQGDRPTLRDWSDRRTEEDIRDYWRTRNGTTLDGADTGIEPGNLA